MARRPDTPCADCGRLTWSSATSLPVGERRCQSCRRENKLTRASRKVCELADCDGRRFVEGLCYKHALASRLERGILCTIDGCAKPLFVSGVCNSHWTAANRAKNGRKQDIYPCICKWCGTEWMATKRSSSYCSPSCYGNGISEQARRRRLPNLHPNPDPLTWLPSKHPSRQPAPRRIDWWQFFVSGPCAWCGEDFTARAASTDTMPRYCSTRCANRAAKQRSGEFVIEPRVRYGIYKRDNWTCQLCMEPVDRKLPHTDPMAATLDHIECQSWVLIPDHSPRNLRLAHRICNSLRGDRVA